KDYTPPVNPTFGTQIGRTFRESIALLTSFGKGIVLIVVAVAPWLPLAALVLVLLRVLARRGGAGPAPRTPPSAPRGPRPARGPGQGMGRFTPTHPRTGWRPSPRADRDPADASR